jgi:DNA-binding transcriptional regulator YdaS (Cro superfamily)
MHRLTATASAALLARTTVCQAAIARLAGVTPRQVNNWCRGRAAVPVWAGLIAVVLQDRSPDALTIDLEETRQALAAPQDPMPRRVAPTTTPLYRSGSRLNPPREVDTRSPRMPVTSIDDTSANRLIARGRGDRGQSWPYRRDDRRLPAAPRRHLRQPGSRCARSRSSRSSATTGCGHPRAVVLQPHNAALRGLDGAACLTLGRPARGKLAARSRWRDPGPRR